ncbi:MinD/ParA family ATP-binding protein [Brachybacterium sp. AOP24-D1-21]|uniref:MinD/ParA family ATP-binding protein n=1 Tax=Brachybacterium sp. AOP24-D1-21 TaxID=3457711 RepID=UPI004033A60B
MIAQARITSDTTATVHLADETVEVSGADLPEIRDRVKQAFITSAKATGQDIAVVIVEPHVRHHLLVEPTGRITGREADDRPLYGPGIDDPLIAPPTDDTADLSSIDQAALRGPVTGEHAAIGSPATGEHAAIGSPATGELPTVRPHGARRRRAAAMPPSTLPAARGGSGPSGVSAVSGTSASLAASAGSGPSATSAVSASSAASAPSALSAPSAPSAMSASSAPSAMSAPSARSALSAPSAPSAASASSASSASPAPSSRPASRTAQETARKRPLPARTVPEKDAHRPTLQDLQSSTSKREKVKATRGVPGFITRLTGGVISPRPNRRERMETERLERIRRPLEGPRNIAVVNLKGGAHKTTASLMVAATLGVTRGGNVLAWDNNETRGTLGWRGIPTDHHRTAVDLLHDIETLRAPAASNADLDPYVRPQGEMRFDILASDEDPGSAASIDETAFADLNDALSRFYRIKVIDTGNNVRASNWLAAVKSADQLVIVSTVREDTFNAAAWMIDELRATGLAEQVDHAVTILSHSSKGKFDPTLRSRLLAHFGAHTRAVTEVPYEQQFVDGSHLDWPRVSAKTKEAWLDATALIIDGL